METTEPETFNPGDIVMLKSGGPKMTVIADQPSATLGDRVMIGGRTVACGWFSEDGPQVLLQDNFNPCTLIRCP